MIKKGKNIPRGHQLSGNRLRIEKKIILKKDIEWKTKLKLRYRFLFWILDWPFALYYKYK